jgi:hypothetical protein
VVCEYHGMLARLRGQLALAERCLRQSLLFARHCGLATERIRELIRLGELLLAQGRVEEAATLLGEAQAVAHEQKVSLPAAARCLELRLGVARGQLTGSKAARELVAHASAARPTERAEALFTAWELTPTPALRERCAQTYRELYARTPDARYRARLLALGEEVPPPAIASPLPQQVPASPPDLGELLRRAQEILTIGGVARASAAHG